jgi:lipooligosaccharide transport system ATP-binding protein
MLTVSRLTKEYRARNGALFTAVADISFAVKPGECFGLLGPNGAGKTTTINCITGFYPATQGEIRIETFDVFTEPKRARQNLGVCSQDETLDSDFNAFDQLVRHATFFRIPVREAKERAGELLERFGIADKSRQPIESLSGGMRRRLQLARALISHPSVLVLDEPTTGLDPDVRRLVWEILQTERSRGAAILLSTHYMEEAERLCDRIAIMHGGKILDTDAPRRLVKKYISRKVVREEVRPGVFWKRPPHLEDVYLKLTGSKLGVEGL